MARLRFTTATHHQAPAGVSLLEVLFAILITSIGLMGAIAIFPAAMMQARRGAQADAAAAAGGSLIHAFDAQGMRQAARWLTYNNSTTSYNVVANPDGSTAYCIDPRFVAANSNNTKANSFPFDTVSSTQMTRVTLSNGTGTTSAMNSLLSNLQFQLEDDLAYDRFRDGVVARDNTLQAASIFERNSSNTALKRQANGHFSWMATLSPKLERLPTGGALEDRYVLSVVVFHNRPGDLTAGTDRIASEWPLKIRSGDFFGAGINGGEVRLTEETSTTPALTTDERLRRLDLKPGQWVMLMSKTQQTVTSSGGGSTTKTMPLCRWYRVVDADDPDETNFNVDVTLAGSDWEYDKTTPSGEADVVVCEGVIAVYEKTIKLEPRS